MLTTNYLNDGTKLTVDLKLDPNGLTLHDKLKDVEVKWKKPGFSELKMTGAPAAYSIMDEYGNNIYDGGDPLNALSLAMGHQDVRSTTGYGLGLMLRHTLNDTKSGESLMKYINKYVPAPVMAALTIGGGSALASWITRKFINPDFISPMPAALIGGSLAAGAKMYFDSHKNSVINDKLIRDAMNSVYGTITKSGGINKQASLYHDPRNFILEKLQRDTQLSMADKALIAGKIRSMSMPEASKVERMVRSAIGVGVGAMLAKYFGVGGVGALVGGIFGGMAFNSMGFGSSAFASTRKPSLVGAFLNGGKGFKTYNEFYRAVNR